MPTLYLQATTKGMDEPTWDLAKQNSMLKQLVEDCKAELYEVYTQVGVGVKTLLSIMVSCLVIGSAIYNTGCVVLLACLRLQIHGLFSVADNVQQSPLLEPAENAKL